MTLYRIRGRCYNFFHPTPLTPSPLCCRPLQFRAQPDRNVSNTFEQPIWPPILSVDSEHPRLTAVFN